MPVPDSVPESRRANSRCRVERSRGRVDLEMASARSFRRSAVKRALCVAAAPVLLCALSSSAAERELQSFREGRQIVALGVEAEAQVQRLAELQTERTQLDAERAALANLLNEIEDGSTQPDYRRLAAFPTFLENEAIADILQELIGADRTRTELLVRVTRNHPDLVAVETRIRQLEEQLGAIGHNYRQSLDDQIASLADGWPPYIGPNKLTSFVVMYGSGNEPDVVGGFVWTVTGTDKAGHKNLCPWPGMQ